MIPENVSSNGANLHDHALAGAVHSESTQLAVMTLSQRTHQRGLPHHLDEGLACVLVLEEETHIAGRHCLLERDGHGQMDTTEPAGDMGCEGYGEAAVVGNLMLVDVARQAVGN